MTPLPPLRREVLVAAPPETAFALFTAHLGAWWPLGGFSVFGDRATVAIEGDRVVERLGGEASTWAEVLAFDPPTGLALAWHPGRAASVATTVTVTFTGQSGGTLVTIEHSGWERCADPAAARTEYDEGWPVVLAAYLRLTVGSDAERVRDDWYVLFHRPGPSVADGQSVFGHPDFVEHAAFLKRLASWGLLVAAGPLPDQPGSGMTVVRVRDPEIDVSDLARTDDESVMRGVLAVDVQPWDVRFTG